MIVQRLSDVRPDHRPRERLFSLGATALTPVELVGILIGTGAVRRDVMVLAREVLALSNGSLRALARRPVAEVARVPGIGPAKAARVAAALELARRLAGEADEPRSAISSPADVYQRCGPALRDLAVEEFHLLTLDVQNRVTRDLLITRGILNSSLVHPREVFRAAIAEAAAGIVVVHNHPSGNPAPSPDDRSVTAQLVQAGRVLDVPVCDHVIVAGDRYFSFAEAGLL
ncbi:MAG TPA: DNA repair protein RadC [Gemmatimonadales bacterium]|jgi:DNA repair protein RadC